MMVGWQACRPASWPAGRLADLLACWLAQPGWLATMYRPAECRVASLETGND